MAFIVDNTHIHSSVVPSQFQNFTTAIKHSNGASANAPVIRNSTFTNNYIGVDLDASLATIGANTTFNIPPWTASYPNSVGINSCMGVLLYGADAYIVNGNTFQNPSTSYCGNVGVLAYKTGGGDNVVNNNSYTFLGTGNLSNFKNTNSSVSSPGGLQFTCNTHSNNVFDIAARGTNYTTDGMRPEQGDAGHPAADVFSADWGGTYNLYNPSQYTTTTPNHEVGAITYWFADPNPSTWGVSPNPQEHPGQPGGATANDYGSYTDCVVVGIDGLDHCTPSIGGIPPVFDGSVVINASPLSGLSTTDYQLVAINNTNYYMNDSSGISHKDSLYYWAREIHSPGGDKLLAQLFLADSLVDSANAIYDSIAYRYGLDSLEQLEYGTFGRGLMNQQLSIMANPTTPLSTLQKSTLQEIYTNANVWAHCLAKNWITSFAPELMGIDFPMVDTFLYPVIPDTTGPKFATEHRHNTAGPATATLFPNPATDEIIVKYTGINAIIKVEDVTGRELISSILQNGNTTINVGGLNPGLYLYKIFEGNALKETGKFVKN